MAFVRRATAKDATWARAWTADALADLVTIGATQEPKHGDIAFVTANGSYYLWMDNNTWHQLTPVNFNINQTFMPPPMGDDDVIEPLIIPGPRGLTGPSGLTGPPGFEFHPSDDIVEPNLPMYPGVLPVEQGGTGMNQAQQGDMIYASGVNLYKRLAKDTSTTRYISNQGASNGPAWDLVNLANGVTGFLLDASFTTIGDWTPAVTFGGAAVGVTYTNQVGKYIKIGRFVFCSGLIQLSANGVSVGNAILGGFPFTIGNANGFFSGVKSSYNNFAVGVQEVGIQTITNTATFFFVKSVAGVNTIMTNADFTATSTYLINASFMV